MEILNFEIEEDTITPYLNQISENYEKASEYHLKDLARVLTGDSRNKSDKGTIGMLMAKWNPNLYLSGQEEDRWLIETSAEGKTIYVNYTGMTWERRYFDEDFKVWWEFSEEIYHAGSTRAIRYIQYVMEPEERTLARDYALYQETQYDRIADPRFARHPHSVREGTDAGSDLVLKKASQYLENIINLK